MRILPKYLLSKQDIALSLTGGLDSRLIIAAASRWPHRYPCYSFGGLYRDCADVKMAKQIAQECHQYHEVVPLSSNFFHEFPSLAMKTVYLTDGSMDVSGSVGLFVNRLAREIAPIRITGNYGGEVLRGLIAFKPETTYEDMFRKDFVPHLQKATTTFIMERDCRRKSFILFKQVPWHHYNRLAMEQSQLTIRSPYLDNEIVALSYQAPEDLSVNRQLILRLISEYYPALDKYPTDRGKISRLWFIPFNIRQWFEELIPRAEYAYDYGMPHWLAKIDHFLYPLHLEKLFLGWQKYYHFRIWYHNELSSFIKEVLLDPSTLSMSLLNGPYIERIVQAHIKGIENHTLEIHKLLTLVFIQKQLIEQ
jgi:asparagine synthase (glutamine-hydrolysing)